MEKSAAGLALNAERMAVAEMLKLDAEASCCRGVY